MLARAGTTRAIADIRVGKRFRRDLGDLSHMAENIGELGLLQAIGITADNELSFGQRRLEACKLAGLSEVPVRLIDDDKKLAAQHAENRFRKALTPSEMVELADFLEPLERAKARQRQGQRTDKHPGKFPGSESGNALDQVARAVGIDRKTLVKMREVVRAAEAEGRFVPLREEMDRRAKVHHVYAELKRIRREEAEAVPSSGDGPDAKVIAGDFRTAGRAVADASVDLIFTDLPYAKEFVPLYGDLAEFGARVLVEGGSLITYLGQHNLPEVLQLMQQHLRWHWICAAVHFPSKRRIIPSLRVQVGYHALLWFTKGKIAPGVSVSDYVRSEPGPKLTEHPWAQGTVEASHFIKKLSRKGALVVDPCLGSGTTGVAAVKLGRRFVGFEIDPDTARKAEQRIARCVQGAAPFGRITEENHDAG
jgi:ParB-like chromosome segregation protein Spo0J